MAHDAVVLGAGPNGLAAAITLARAGLDVLLVEARDVAGGGVHTAELTLPGYLHDVCSSAYPMAAGSPLFRVLGLERHGLEWVQTDALCAHPFDDGTAAVLERSVSATADGLGPDAAAYRARMGGLARDWDTLAPDVLGPPHPPRHPLLLARFGLAAARPYTWLASSWFSTERARALLAGVAAHGTMRLDQPFSAGFALVLGLAGHAAGWPLAKGGSAHLAMALARTLAELGGTLRTGWRVRALDELPRARAVLLDVPPQRLLELAGDRLPARFRRRLATFRHGPGAFKLDWALSGPIPWRAPECARAATIHLGGTLEEMCASEGRVWDGEHPERPYVLLIQPTLFDPSRAPAGRHTAWAYCHVPNGSSFDMTERIEAQIERFAPGFRDLVLARSVRPPRDLERDNPNLIGGDINGGANSPLQMAVRPTLRYHGTPVPGLYLCSSSTPPGGGVHGMSGYHSARRALREVFGIRIPFAPR